VARRLILDTGILIASERDRGSLSHFISDDDDLVIAAITVAELRIGIELAGPPHRAARSEFLLRVLETLPVEPYDASTAEAHGRLLAHVYRSGTQREAHDLIIAATALTSRRIILTNDRNARFSELPDVECLVMR
jgi:tRNA(fMet)-specific endonuclease VapC